MAVKESTVSSFGVAEFCVINVAPQGRIQTEAMVAANTVRFQYNTVLHITRKQSLKKARQNHFEFSIALKIKKIKLSYKM